MYSLTGNPGTLRRRPPPAPPERMLEYYQELLQDTEFLEAKYDQSWAEIFRKWVKLREELYKPVEEEKTIIASLLPPGPISEGALMDRKFELA